MNPFLHKIFSKMKRVSPLLFLTLLLVFAYPPQHTSAQASNKVFNDGGIDLKIWLEGVWTDANCNETLDPLSGKVKYVFENLEVRASRGSGFSEDNFPDIDPLTFLLLGNYPVQMTFAIKDVKTKDIARFWRPNNSDFYMLNPWYPFQPANMGLNLFGKQEVVPANISAYKPWAVGEDFGKPAVGGAETGIQNTNRFLLLDKSFPSEKAPDRFQWRVNGMWESDADFDGKEAGVVVCNSVYGLPQVAELRRINAVDAVKIFTGSTDQILDRIINSFEIYMNPYLFTMMLGMNNGQDNIIEYLLRVTGCADIFGINLNPNNIFGMAVNFLITDGDDSYAAKQNWNEDEALIRGTPPGQKGYFGTKKVEATRGRDKSGEGYFFLFSYQWNWRGTTYNELETEPGYSVKIQEKLCPDEVYTDGPITVEAYIDGLFQDNDHEGHEFLEDVSFLGLFEFDLDLGFAGCTDMSFPKMDQKVGKTEEIRIRGKAWATEDGDSGWKPTIGWEQDRPGWHNISPSTSGAKIFEKSYSSSDRGMRSFQFALEAWESDCWTAEPQSSCGKVCVAALSNRCCIANMPFSSSKCLIPGFESTAGDLDRHKVISTPIKINWRNSPPNVDNYYHVPIGGLGNPRANYVARIKYKWTLDKPRVIVTNNYDYDITLCPSETDTLTANTENATFYQWQYAEVDGPAGPACPTGVEWIDINNAICPTYTIPAGNKTRFYRLKVFNRAGEGSRSPNGEKFAEAYSHCIRVQRLPQPVEMHSFLECGTNAEPTIVRSGLSSTFSAVQPPAQGSLDVPGLKYKWGVTGGASVTPDEGNSVTVTFPSEAEKTVRVRMTTSFEDICGVELPQNQDCYFKTEDGGCDELTGVYYVSPNATGGIGSINNPFSLANAFKNMSPKIKHIKMLAGEYDIRTTGGSAWNRIDSALIITDSLVVDGGYVEDVDEDGSLIWVKKSDERSIINSSIVEQLNDSIMHTIGFRAMGVNHWTIQDVTINMADAPNRHIPTYGRGHGLSNYGILISNAQGYTLQNVSIKGGKAGPGNQGETPSFGSGHTYQGGDLGIDITDPAPGGDQANGNPEAYYTGTNFLDGGVRIPGHGGRAGVEPQNSGYPIGAAGDGQGGISAISATGPGAGGRVGSPNPNGNSGANGANYVGSSGSIQFNDLQFMPHYFVPGTRPPHTGAPGHGGGGGAYGGSGNGGAGGIGGRGGTAGYSGGGAFCIWVSGVSSGIHSTLDIDASNIGEGFGEGAGGSGGLGESGQEGGKGSGNSADGGNGGRGGRGPDGVRGYSRGEHYATTVSIGGSPQPATSYVKADYNSGCTNSVFRIWKTNAANWDASFGQNVFDITSTKGSTVGGQDSPKLIYFPNTSFAGKGLQTNHGTYSNQVYVRYDRAAPEIEELPTRVCADTPIDLISNPNSDMDIEYRWTIQEGTTSTIVSKTSPTPTFIFTSKDVTGVVLPNTTSGSVHYQIKFEVKDACCGWSIPVYKYIEVLPEYVNVIEAQNQDKDTIWICNTGKIPALRNKVGVIQSSRPPNPVYEWQVSKDGAPFEPIAGATAQTLPAQQFDGDDDMGVYRFRRWIGSSNPTVDCEITSNIITVIVDTTLHSSLITDPSPTLCLDGAYPKTNVALNTNNLNVGYIGGNVPEGPQGAVSYRWEKGVWATSGASDITFVPVTTTAPTESGTTPETKDLDMGYGGAFSYSYGSSDQVYNNFQEPKNHGEIYFRRIAELDADPTNCKDTSNVVAAIIPRGVNQWGNCPSPSGVSNTVTGVTACQNYVMANAPGYTIDNLVPTGIAGQGLCLVSAPDTVCTGTLVNPSVPSTVVNNDSTAKADLYAWYMVPGGPYNFNTDVSGGGRGGRYHFCSSGSPHCTNPLDGANCSNGHPGASAAEFLGTTMITLDTLGNQSGSSMPHLLFETATFYVNIFDECFTDADFRAASDPTKYQSDGIWQRKTIVVREAVVGPEDLTANPNRYCSDDIPDFIDLVIVEPDMSGEPEIANRVGGILGNSGVFQIFVNDTTNINNLIYQSDKSDNSLAGRTFTLPAPTQTTTYYARSTNIECNHSPFVEVEVIVDEASEDPDELLGPAGGCIGEEITLTVSGGSLGEGAEWTLYKTNTSAANRLERNTTGIFNVIPTASGNQRYIVRGEYTDNKITCNNTAIAQIIIPIEEDCLCDPPGYIEYAEVGKHTLATYECDEGDGWTYYSDVNKPEEYLFAIQKKPTDIPTGNTVDFNATVKISVTHNPTDLDEVFYNHDGTCEANFVMPRYWNVELVGTPKPTLDGFVRIRFYFPPAELTATRNRATQWMTTESNCSEPLTVGPNQVFKSYADEFIPRSGNANSLLTGGLSTNRQIQPTTINNYNYIGHLMSNLPHGDTYPQTQMGKNYVQVVWDGFSGGGVAVRVSPDLEVLPVTLVSFTGTLIEDEVMLNWQTASELNNDHFVVEKSVDAKNWTAIGSVKGHGTTHEPHSYSLVDGHPFEGVNYYRLKQVDYDGSFDYSRIIMINYQPEVVADQSFSVQPNPTAGPVTASISSDIDQHVNMRILDIRGGLVGDREVTLGKGMNHVKVDLSHYPAATYILSFTDKQGVEHNAKVVKQ